MVKQRSMKENTSYLIGTDGSVYNITRKRFLKPYVTNKGYAQVTIAVKGKRKKFLVHRLVASLFIDVPKESSGWKRVIVNHIDGDKLNNNVSNLEWCNDSHNNKHAYSVCGKTVPQSTIDNIAAIGRLRKGKILNDMRKLKDDDISNIKCLYGKGFTLNKIADMYNVSRPTISNYLKQNGVLVSKKTTHVVALFKDGTEVEYDSVCEASRATSTQVSNIHKAITGERNQAGGIIWKLLKN